MPALEELELRLWQEWATLNHSSTCLAVGCHDCAIRDCILGDLRHHEADGCPSCSMTVMVPEEW
jgi:hypothetical protein